MPKAKPSIDPEDIPIEDRMQREFDRQSKEYADLFEAFAKEDPSVLDDNVESKMQAEFDRLEREYPKLSLAFATEDDSVFDDDK